MGAAVEAGAAGEKTVAVSDLHDIFIGAARSDDRSGAALFPHIDVFLCVESDNALSGSTGCGLDADTVLEVSAQKAVGIRFAEVIFGQERKLVDVIDALNIFGFHAFLVHEIAVVGDIVIDIFDLLHNLFVLDLEDLFAGGGFDLFLVIVFHNSSFPCFEVTSARGLWHCAKKGAAPVEVPRLC